MTARHKHSGTPRVLRSAGLHHQLGVEPGPPPQEAPGVRAALVGGDGVVMAYVDGFNPAKLRDGERLDHATQAQPGEHVDAPGQAVA